MRFFSIMLICSLCTAQNNLLENGDFELWQQDLPTGWAFMESTDDVSVVQTGDTVFSGESACKVSFVTQDQSATDFVSGIIQVTPGQSYLYDSRIFDNDPAGRARFAIYWYDVDTVYISRQFIGSYSKDSPDWQQINREIIADAPARYAAFGFRFYDEADAWDGNCIIYIDSVSVSLAPTNPPELLNMSPDYFSADTLLVLRASVTDDIGVDSVSVQYFFNGDSSVQYMTHLDPVGEDIYETKIPAQNHGTPFSYRFLVSDKDTIPHVFKSSYHNILIGKTPLQIAGTVDDSGCLVYENFRVYVTGVVTAGSGTFAEGHHNDYIQDKSGAINIYSTQADGLIVTINQGDSIGVWGKLVQYTGRSEIMPDSIVIMKSNVKEINPKYLYSSDIDEDYEGYLVRVGQGRLSNWTENQDTSFFAQLEAENGLFQIYINRYTDIDGMVNPGLIDSLEGIVFQNDPNPPYSEGYYIMPRSRKDIYYHTITPVAEQEPPLRFHLYSNYPNPFNPETVIRYQVGANNHSPVHVDLSVYNILGQKVRTLVSGKKHAGLYQVLFQSGNLPSGLYLYRIKTDTGYIKTRKMVLCK